MYISYYFNIYHFYCIILVIITSIVFDNKEKLYNVYKYKILEFIILSDLERW